MVIKETIVVEGKDDISAVRSAVDADIICTRGYGISLGTVEKIKNAYEKNGIIIFTDPDHAGLAIRNKLTQLFPQAKQAHLSRFQAEKKGDIGIENAAPDDIIRALSAVSSCTERDNVLYTMEDMEVWGLSGCADSAIKRERLGAALGIGYANAKGFLKRLNFRGISRAEIESMLQNFTNI